MTDEPLLSVRDLKKHYSIRRGLLNRTVAAAKAVDGISFDIYPGETVGLVGESGCGKSTAASSIIRLEEPTSGEVIFNGGGRQGRTRNPDGTHPNDVAHFDKEELKAFRRDAQMIFQDPSSSFDPRMTIGNSIGELLLVHGMSDKHLRRSIIEDLLEQVGLSASDYDRYPHEFSGGQKQRIALARALVLNPELIVADEPVSALDVSIKAEILSLINDLQEEYGLSLLFISHDMSVIRKVCDRVAVMYLGEIVELGATEDIFADPKHPYTEALLSSIPTPDPRTSAEGIELKGTVPSPINPPSGCRFHTRCHRVIQPEGLDIDQNAFQGIMNLRQDITSGALDVDSLDKLARAELDIEGSGAVSEADRKRVLRADYDLPQQLADTAAERVVSEAIEAVLNDQRKEALSMLEEEFSSRCEREDPEFTEFGGRQRAACHLLEDRSVDDYAQQADSTADD